MTTPTSAGWYDDPDNANAQRYWDGHDWTPQRQRKPTSPPPARASAPSTPSESPPRPAAPIAERPPTNEEFPAAVERFPETAPTAPGRKRPTTMALLVGAVVFVTVALALAIGIPALTQRPTATAPIVQPSTPIHVPAITTATTPPPVAESALGGLLLSPDQINEAMGATDMTIGGPALATGWFDVSEIVADKACLPLYSPIAPSAYAGSGSSGLPRSNGLYGKDIDLKAYQAVVSFSSPRDAGAFFTTSAGRWPNCQHFSETSTGKPDKVWSVGPVSNSNGLLSVTTTMGGGDSSWTWDFLACQRALTVANNVVIDVLACSRQQSINSAVNIANQIAAKVREMSR